MVVVKSLALQIKGHSMDLSFMSYKLPVSIYGQSIKFNLVYT